MIPSILSNNFFIIKSVACVVSVVSAVAQQLLGATVYFLSIATVAWHLLPFFKLLPLVCCRFLFKASLLSSCPKFPQVPKSKTGIFSGFVQGLLSSACVFFSLFTLCSLELSHPIAQQSGRIPQFLPCVVCPPPIVPEINGHAHFQHPIIDPGMVNVLRIVKLIQS